MAAKASKEQQSHVQADAAVAAAAEPADSSTTTNGLDGASTEQQSRASLLESIRTEAKGDLYVAFQTCLRQLIDGKMEASTYEDVLRTLLGTNAYLLFTLHKVISQALKQLQMLLVEEASQTLLELYHYERCRASAGALSESTYRSNARMILEGDDCFCMDQLYSAGGAQGGALVLSFLPEKEDDNGDDDEVEEEDDDEEEQDEAGKAEAVEYTKSFVLVSRASRSKMLLKRTTATRERQWDATVQRNGLECRTAIGSCKLRFVTRSEDVWFANTLRKAAKRASRSVQGGSKAKRQKLEGLAEKRLPKDAGALNALAGMPPPSRAPLPKQHKLKPLEPPPAEGAAGASSSQ